LINLSLGGKSVIRISQQRLLPRIIVAARKAGTKPESIQ
jgi:hypothetical protein